MRTRQSKPTAAASARTNGVSSSADEGPEPGDRAVFSPSQLAAVVGEPVTPKAKPKPPRRRKPAAVRPEPAIDPAQDKTLIVECLISFG